MAGQNHYLNPTLRVRRKSRAIYLTPCVFISHQRDDSDMAQAVADTLATMDIDYWLDLDQIPAGTLPTTQEEHLRLTEAIEEGLHNATHLLALITKSAQLSWWVPYEIGSCRALGRKLAFLLSRYVPNPPSYVAAGLSIADQESLCTWADGLKSHPSAKAGTPRLKRSSRLDPFVLREAAGA